jgi:hypothetical protein
MSLKRSKIVPPVFDIPEGGKLSRTLYSWLQETLDLQSSEERDVVYALLGLASDVQNGELDLMPDYAVAMTDIKDHLLQHWGCSLLPEVCKNNNIQPNDIQSSSFETSIQLLAKHAIASGDFLIMSDVQGWLFSQDIYLTDLRYN